MGTEAPKRKTVFKHRGKRSRPFTQIDNEPLQDRDLSIEAVGLLACVVSLPEDCEFDRTWALWRFKIGREKFDRIVKELIEKKYVRREQDRDPSGKLASVVYLFTDEPGCFENDASQPPLPGKPYSGGCGKNDRNTGLPRAGFRQPKPYGGSLYKESNKEISADARISKSLKEAEERQPPAEPQSPEQRKKVGGLVEGLAASLRMSRACHNSPKPCHNSPRRRRSG